MAHAAKESFEVLFVNVIIIPIIDCLESSSDREIVTGLKRPFNIFSFQVHGNLLVNELTHGSFNAHREKLIGIQLLIRSLSGCRPQERVVAR